MDDVSISDMVKLD